MGSNPIATTTCAQPVSKLVEERLCASPAHDCNSVKSLLCEVADGKSNYGGVAPLPWRIRHA